MEKWDLYAKYREKTGKEHIRGEMIPEGFYHLVVHVWIRNRKGDILSLSVLPAGQHFRLCGNVPAAPS